MVQGLTIPFFLLFFLSFLQDIVDAVRVLYKPDFNNTLNGIRYDIPDALQNMMQSRQDRRTLEESSEP